MKDLFDAVSTIDTGDRSDFDFYETPAWMTRSLLHYHGHAIRGLPVLEPCSGRGAIASILLAYGCTVFTNDLDTRHPADTHFYATLDTYWERHAPSVAWVITNVPFNVAFPILQLALKHARIGVALLLRKTFLEPTDERGPWLQEHPPDAMVGLPRHSFRGRGSDSVSSDWYFWHPSTQYSERPFVIDHFAEKRTRNEV